LFNTRLILATEFTRPKSSWLLCLEYSSGERVRN